MNLEGGEGGGENYVIIHRNGKNKFKKKYSFKKKMQIEQNPYKS